MQHISRNIRFLISEVGKIITFTFTSYKSCKGTFSVLKCIKTYIGSNMGNNWLYALILVHVHINILDKINLADIEPINLLIKKRAANKHSDIFLRIIHNICKIKLTLDTFCTSLIFIFPIQCIKCISCVPFYPSLNKFP